MTCDRKGTLKQLNMLELKGGGAKMGRIPSDQEIDQVHKYIEYCILHYMNKKETIDILAVQGNIEPAFTRTVWDKLEQDNQEFFRAYNVKLLVKDQIKEFNRLLSKQVELMCQHRNIEINDGPYSDGSHVSTRQISTPNSAQSSREHIQQQQQQLNIFSDDGSSIQSCLQGTSDWSIHSRDIGVSPNMVLAQRMNEQIVRTGRGYAGGSSFSFSSSNFLESRPLMGENIVSDAEHPNDFLLD